MNRHLIFVGRAVLVALVALPLFALAPAQSFADGSQPVAAAASQAQASQASGGTDSNPVGQPEVVIPAKFQPTRADLASAAASASTTVYFTPQDENTSDTLLFLYSTNATTSTVDLQTFNVNGSLTISTTVAVPPNGLVRISGDSVNTVSASWAGYVLVNFTTFSAYAKMTVPTGVKADGYVAWDTLGFYDPLSATETLPLRFSTDPASVFLPAVQR